MNYIDLDRADYLYRNKEVISPLSFGIDFLDHATRGILPNDLIVLGAKSGVGKTMLSTLIAQTNVSNLKNVMFYALEAEENEIFTRMLHREVSGLYNKATGGYVNYVDFYMKHNLNHLREYIKKATANIRLKYMGMQFTYKNTNEVTAADLRMDIAARHEHTDLFIIDHLHYIDINDDNELRATKDLVKELRDTSICYGKPIILVAHLRKKDRYNNDIVPGLDEFHGSSDITKIATKVITFAGCHDEGIVSPYLHPTLIKVAKNRLDGSICKYTGKILFNSRLNSYEKEYNLALDAECKGSYQPITDKKRMPKWAKGANNVYVENNEPGVNYGEATKKLKVNTELFKR